MKCNECGSTGFAGSSCPDCGSENVLEVAGVQAQIPATAPAPEPAAMPDVDMTVSKGPVVGIVRLPDGTGTEMHEGDTFTVAHETSENDPTYRVSGDDTVSGKPITVTATDSKGVITGGGGSGFALDFTVRFKPDQVVELPKNLADLVVLLQTQGGNCSLTATALKVGKSTRFPLKF